LIGLFFVLIGSALVLSPLWVWLQVRHATYAITNQRAILILPPLTDGRGINVLREEIEHELQWNFRESVPSFSGQQLSAFVRA
jgi:hypothetical protein